MRPSRAVEAPPAGCTINDWKEMLSITNEHPIPDIEKRVKSDGGNDKRENSPPSGSAQNITKVEVLKQIKLNRLQSTSNESVGFNIFCSSLKLFLVGQKKLD